MSEDCLQLNVFVPRDVVTIGTGMPVLVFVHGGGFFGGSANSVDGSLLVSAAARVVSISERGQADDRVCRSSMSRSNTELASSASRKSPIAVLAAEAAKHAGCKISLLNKVSPISDSRTSSSHWNGCRPT